MLSDTKDQKNNEEKGKCTMPKKYKKPFDINDVIKWEKGFEKNKGKDKINLLLHDEEYIIAVDKKHKQLKLWDS